MIGRLDARTLFSGDPKVGGLERVMARASRASKSVLCVLLVCCTGCGLLDPFLGRACVDLPIDKSLQTGIRGMVTLGPTCPVEQPGEVCVEPYEADLRIECPDGFDIVTAHSDATGEFEVRLPPGRYRVVPLQQVPTSPFPVASPVDVVVPAEGFAQVQIEYVTGIR